MNRSVRACLLVALALAATLLAQTGASAAPGDPVPLFAPGPSPRYDSLVPVGQTAAGLVWQVEDQPGLLVKVTGGPTSTENSLADPIVKGELITSLDEEAGTVTWRTIAGPDLHVHEMPEGLEYASRTSKGYLAQRGSGPYEIVTVDLLAGTPPRVLGWKTNFPFLQLTAGPNGVLGATAKPGGELRYYPYGTPGEGRRIDGSATNDCPVVTAMHALCAGPDGRMLRRPLSVGSLPVSAAGDVSRVVPTATGVAFLVGSGTGTYTLRRWESSSAGSVPVGTPMQLNGRIAAGRSGTSALVGRDQAGDDPGVWSVALPSGTQTRLRAADQQQRIATAVAIGPARVAWTDNAVSAYTVWSRGLNADATLSGAPHTFGEDAPRGTPSVGTGAEVVWTSDLGLRIPTVGWENIPGVLSVTASGTRLLEKTVSDDGTQWRIRARSFYGFHDAAPLAALPPAVDYDLWGDRLIRLAADGEVSVLDLRTDGDPVVVRDAGPDGEVSGEVHVAGDAVAWEVIVGGTPERMIDDLAEPGPASPLTDFEDVLDLSTGYVVGRQCPGGECTTVARALDDGEITPLGDARAVAVDGNRVAVLGADGLATVRALPAYADPPRLLREVVDPSALAAPGRNWRMPVVTSRVLSSCVFEILDADGVVVRSLDCGSTGGQAALAWGGLDADGNVLPDGSYDWRIVADADGEALVDYDGDPSVSGTLTVDDLEPSAFAGSPSGFDTAVGLGVHPTVSFSEAVTGADATNVTLRRTAGGPPVPATVELSVNGRTATLRPDAPLDPDTSWTVGVGQAGNPLVDSVGQPVTPTSYTFTTGPVPTVTARYPAPLATGAGRTANMVVAFSEPITGADVNTVTLRESSGRYVPVSVTFNPTSRRLSIDPGETLRAGHRYTVGLQGGPHSWIRDVAGNPFGGDTWQFTTGK